MDLGNIKNKDGCFWTHTGIKFNLFNPTVEMIDICDIARSLSHNPHFNGHTPQFFSIAQHCLLTVSLIPGYVSVTAPDMPLMALLHDAAEAYIGDMISPLKAHMPEFRKIEDTIMEVVCKKFNLDMELMSAVKPYDLQAQQIEFDGFRSQSGLNYLKPDEAYDKFIEAFNTLTKNYLETL